MKRLVRICLALLLLCPSACLAHEHRVGVGPLGTGSAVARQYYLLFGLVRLNEVDSQRLALDRTSFAVRTSFSFWDFVLAPVLLPLTICSRTVVVTW
ncbi:MAG TPA: hypothetical protein VK081_03560 [Planctomycetota bacterium]|nr:hypothetical protein [Planctomycetota bacterium]